MTLSRMTAAAMALLLLTAGVSGVMAVSTDVFAQPDETPVDTTPTDPDETPADDSRPSHAARGDWPVVLERALQQLDLTDEQVDDIVSEAEAMRADGATHREIEAMVREKLDEYGVDVSALHPVHRHYHRHHDRHHKAPWDVHPDRFLGLFDLSDEERDAIVAGAEQLRADGATRDEIREYVLDQLEANGYDREDVLQRVWEHRGDRLQDRFDLTDEQVDDVVTEAVQMRLDGASSNEVRDMVVEKLEALGVDVTHTGACLAGAQKTERDSDGTTA